MKGHLYCDKCINFTRQHRQHRRRCGLPGRKGDGNKRHINNDTYKYTRKQDYCHDCQPVSQSATTDNFPYTRQQTIQFTHNHHGSIKDIYNSCVWSQQLWLSAPN